MSFKNAAKFFKSLATISQHSEEDAKEEEIEEESNAPKKDNKNQTIKATVVLEFPKIDASVAREKEGAFVLTIKTEQAMKRSPVYVTAVMDTSSSMKGAKIQALKDTIREMLRFFGEQDQFSLVSFSDEGKTLMPFSSMNEGGKNQAQAAIDTLSTSGGTNLCGGVIEALRGLIESREDIEEDTVCSIFLLTDGEITCGVRDCRGIVDAVKQNLPKEIKNLKMPTFGFGADHDANLLASISKEFDSPYSFISDTNEIMGAFKVQMESIANVVAQNVSVRVLPVHCKKGSLDIITPWAKRTSRTVKDGGIEVPIGLVYANSSKRILFRSQYDTTDDPEIHLATAKINFLNVETKILQELESKVVVRLKKESKRSMTIPEPEVVLEKNLSIATLALERAKDRKSTHEEIENAIKQIEKSTVSKMEESVRLIQLLIKVRDDLSRGNGAMATDVVTAMGQGMRTNHTLL